MPVSRLPVVGADTTSYRKLRRNAYATAGHQELSWQDQLIVMACAVQDAARCDPLFAHVTAAAVWGLPMIGSRSELVEHSLPPDAQGRSANVRRRRTALQTPYVDIGDLRVTPYERTIVDHARHASLESAVSVCDDALHRSLTTRDALLAEWQRFPRAIAAVGWRSSPYILPTRGPSPRSSP